MILRLDSASEIKSAFESAGRDYFSYEACDKLLEIYDEDEEFDAVAICGDWTEYDCDDDLENDFKHLLSFDEYKEQYYDEDEEFDEDEAHDDYIEELKDEIGKVHALYHLHGGSCLVSAY